MEREVQISALMIAHTEEHESASFIIFFEIERHVYNELNAHNWYIRREACPWFKKCESI